MSYAVVKAGLLVGFLTTWGGLFCLVIAAAWGNFSALKVDGYKRLPYWRRQKLHDAGTILGVKTRLGRVGLFLVSIGLALLILFGVVWLVLWLIEMLSVYGFSNGQTVVAK